ncbi:hypothetical protein SAMD00023353_5101000 [Rosellinia necatrix]|uniref:Uncharacterized protein n=1 Tax=Rosellinia necatrix TaxID=77044 RepID=A0A1W2TR67_ROSNE|nr:hypothetical protein SAMD00023353_5101000 [Rosellinia necatrix]
MARDCVQDILLDSPDGSFILQASPANPSSWLMSSTRQRPVGGGEIRELVIGSIRALVAEVEHAGRGAPQLLGLDIFCSRVLASRSRLGFALYDSLGPGDSVVERREPLRCPRRTEASKLSSYVGITG